VAERESDLMTEVKRLKHELKESELRAQVLCVRTSE
jgi:hypothetical protein